MSKWRHERPNGFAQMREYLNDADPRERVMSRIRLGPDRDAIVINELARLNDAAHDAGVLYTIVPDPEVHPRTGRSCVLALFNGTKDQMIAFTETMAGACAS